MRAATTEKIRIDAAALEAAKWLEELKERTNEKFFPLYFDHHRFLVLMGGGGSGKSIFAGQKILERARSEPGHRFLVCRKVANTLRDSCFHQLVEQIGDYYPDDTVKINRSDMRIFFPNGSEILFSGLDDVAKLKSIHNITGEWIEEASELEEGDLNQLNIRLRGETAFYKQIILSFNPISATHWLKTRFFDNADPRAITHRSTYRDNRFLDDEAVVTLESFKDTDPYYYAVYALGEWGVLGSTVFPAGAVQQRLSELEPGTVGDIDYIYNGERVEDPGFRATGDGWLTVYHAPEPGVPYVIGVDTAGHGSDWNVAQVINNITGGQVAVLRRQRLDEDVFARSVAALGYWYNTALIAVEVNFSSYPVMELERIRYPKQYVREILDSYTHRPRQAFGWRTDQASREVAVSGLVRFARENLELIHDRPTLEEMLTFVRNEQGRAEAESGAHDDCIMALAIAHAARGQQSYARTAQDSARTVWTQDMWEDWHAADAEGRRYLMQKWGRPKR